MFTSVGNSRSGFTLIEILVALILIGLMAGTLLPSVMNNIERGEINRIHEDLEAANTAAKGFRVDVQRWPGDLEDVAVQPSTAASDSALTGGLYPATLQSRWSGPYLEIGGVASGIPTAVGGTILNRLGLLSWNGEDFLAIKVLNVAESDARTLSVRVDGDTTVGHALDTAGKVRWRAGSDGVDTLIYLGSPVQ